MKNNLIIVGGKAGSEICYNIFKENKNYNKIFFLENFSNNLPNDLILLGNIEDNVGILLESNVDYFIATGDNKVRYENFKKIFEKTNKIPVNCVDKSSKISSNVEIGFGNLIMPNTFININSKIGNCTIINTGSIVEHDCFIDDFVQISPNATLCGYVKCGKFSFIGAGSTIIPNINIKENVIVGAGSVVIRDLDSNTTNVGVPAKRKK